MVWCFDSLTWSYFGCFTSWSPFSPSSESCTFCAPRFEWRHSFFLGIERVIFYVEQASHSRVSPTFVTLAPIFEWPIFGQPTGSMFFIVQWDRDSLKLLDINPRIRILCTISPVLRNCSYHRIKVSRTKLLLLILADCHLRLEIKNNTCS